MNKRCLILFLLLSLLLAGCARETKPLPTEESTVPAKETAVSTTAPAPSVPTTQPSTAPETQPAHSDLYIPGVPVEDVVLWFNEVCLDAEFVLSGDASKLQRWETPIYYTVLGDPTEEDRAVLSGFVQWLNTIEGFPGIFETDDPALSNLYYHFCDQERLLEIMGDSFSGLDGAVTFWYENNAIYTATICCRTELDQTLRNSVILEELYNGLGPVQDTSLRSDSIIYSGFSMPQELTETDELLLKLLYHPLLQCGMDAAQCEAVIRQLYY